TLLQQSLAWQRALPDPAGEAVTLVVLARLQRLSGEKSASLESAQLAWKLVGATELQREKTLALQARMEAHAALGQSEPALAVARQLYQAQMDALKTQRLEILADLQSRNQEAAEKLEVEKLRNQAELQGMQLQKAELLRNSIIAMLLVVLIAGLALLLMQRRRHKLLAEVSATDPLTGLKNRHAGTHALNALAKRPHAVTGMRHVLFLIDVDHFKHINDTYGHHAGDNVLAQLASHLQAACRPGDMVIRWGGEEFVVACPDLTY
ncbi:MAG: GGDEF domain-containing protein, partial [Pseudoxanthomonas sp.]